MYEPKPIDTSDVVLPAELLALTEKIAENVHEVFRMTSLRKARRNMTGTPRLKP